MATLNASQTGQGSASQQPNSQPTERSREALVELTTETFSIPSDMVDRPDVELWRNTYNYNDDDPWVLLTVKSRGKGKKIRNMIILKAIGPGLKEETIMRLDTADKGSRFALKMGPERGEITLERFSKTKTTCHSLNLHLLRFSADTELKAKTAINFIHKMFHKQGMGKVTVEHPDPESGIGLTQEAINQMFRPVGNFADPEFQEILAEMYRERGSIGGFLDTWPGLQDRS